MMAKDFVDGVVQSKIISQSYNTFIGIFIMSPPFVGGTSSIILESSGWSNFDEIKAYLPHLPRCPDVFNFFNYFLGLNQMW